MNALSFYVIGTLIALLFVTILLLYTHYIKHNDIFVKDVVSCAAISFGSWLTVFAFIFCGIVYMFGTIFEKIKSMKFWNKRLF